MKSILLSIFNWVDRLVNKIAKNYTLWIFGLLIIFTLIGLKAYSTAFPPLPDPPVYSSFVVLQPEWSNERRERYYQTSQGSLVVPYDWYKALEFRTGTQLFSSPEIQTRYGLLPDNDPKYNPEQLPVGVMKDIVPEQYKDSLGEGHKVWASISCAACHTGQIVYKGTAMRIDGGQGFWGFEQWAGDLATSLMLTASIPSKFERFCSRVYGHGEGGKCSKDEKQLLGGQMRNYFNSPLILDAINAIINHTYLSKEGFTRTAALGRGVNGVFGPFDRRNINRSAGPVSFPPLWYTHEYDWVQSPAAIRQPLGRNVTEAWGVSVRVELKDPKKLFASTARIENMFWVETLLSTLQAPKWPENILGPIDRERAERGRRLYNEAVWDKAPPADQIELTLDKAGMIRGPNPNRPKTGYCARCHAPALELEPNQYGRKYIQLPLYDMTKMGTDKYDAEEFNARQVYTGSLAPVYGNKEKVGIGDALTVSTNRIMDRWFTEHGIGPDDPCRPVMQGFRDNNFRAPVAYPARPLDGYWATGPFLHNGSVRTLYELLSPVEERAKTFWLGTREFDPLYVGFRDDHVIGAFLYDTSVPGNSNAGHEFRDAPPNTPGVIGPWLSREQRLDIIEYMKVLSSVQVTPEQSAERLARLDAMTPYYEGYNSPTMYGTPETEGGFKMIDFCRDVVNATQKKDTAPPAIEAAPQSIEDVPQPAK